MPQTQQKQTQQARPSRPAKTAQVTHHVQPQPYPYGYPVRPVQAHQQKPIKKQQMPAKPKEKKKHYWWRYLLFSLLGFTVALGGIAVGGYAVAANVPAKNYISLFGGNPDDIITKAYQEDSLIALITKFADGTIKVDSLGGIASFTPLVDKLYDEVNKSIQSNLGVGLDKDEFYSQNFSKIGDYLFTYFKGKATLAAFLKIEDPTTQTKIIQYFCYKKDADGNLDYDSPRTIDEVMAGLSNNSLLDNAKLCELFDINPDSKLYKFKDITLSEFTNNFDEKINEMKISDLITIDITDPNCHPFLKSLVVNEVKVGELSDYLNNRLRFADLVANSDSKIIQTLIEKNPLISEIGDTVENITIAEIINIDASSSRILQSIKDWKISELETKFNSLTISAIFTEEEIAANKFLSSIPTDTLLSDFGDAIKNLKVVDVFAEEIWGSSEHTTANIQGKWKYLLLHGLDDSSEDYKTYNVANAMTTMIDNMQYNMTNSTINQLLADGMIDVSSEVQTTLLTKNSMTEDTVEQFLSPTGVPYGDLTVADFITRISWFISKI